MLCGLLLPFAWGQGARATLGGRVIDPQGAVVVGAQVTVAAAATGVKQTTTTNEQGNWIVQALIPGMYSVTVSAPGFKTADRHALELQTGDGKLIDTRLEVGAAGTEVQVVAESPLIDVTSATSGTVITSQEIAEMPSSSRVATLLATLSPGVMAQDQNQNVARLWSHDAASQFTVDGGRNNQCSNNFELDGMPNLKSGGQVAFLPAPDAIQEFRVVMNAYDAALGRQAGGAVQMTSRSRRTRCNGPGASRRRSGSFGRDSRWGLSGVDGRPEPARL